MNPVPFILLNLAGILIVLLYLLIQERKLNRLLERSNPEFPDLTPMFIELQQRISSESEETRKRATSHARNTQTSMKMLAEWTKKHGIAGEQLAENISRAIQTDGQKIRERIAQVKTRMADEERDDQRSKSAARRIASLMESGSEVDIQSDPTLPEGTMVLRDEETGDETQVSGITPETLVKVSKKAGKSKKKRKGAK